MTTNQNHLLGVVVIWECCQYVYSTYSAYLGATTLSIQYNSLATYVLSYIQEQERFTEATENFVTALEYYSLQYIVVIKV